MEDTASESTDGGNSGRRIVIIRVPASDIFLESDCRSVCSGNFFRGEDDGSAGNDIFPGEICFCIFLYVDHCCICGCTYFHWIYPVVVQKNDTYGNPSCGYICSAITDFVVTFAEDSDIVNLHGWSQGSFSGMSWSNVEVAFAVIGVTVVLTFFLSKPIGAYQLGEAYAQSMGVNIRFFRVALILLSSVLSASVTAFAGPISFVGIAVPYLIKHALQTSKPLVVIPGTFIGGAVFCMICDLIARMAFAPMELNISTVTSIFGAPIVIFMMVHGQKGR